MLKPQDKAPAFSSTNQNDSIVSLSDYNGKMNIILYFYPKDDTPGCTIEANDFTKLSTKFSELQTVVIGVSKDSCESHIAFINKFGLNVELLADVSGEVCEAYGVWQEKERNGEKKMGIVRSTFVIDKKGLIVEAIYNVDPNGHAEVMLEVIKEI